MIINLTDMFIDGTDSDAIDMEDAQLLNEAIGDIDRVDEVGLTLAQYEANEIIVDVDEEYFVALQAELQNTKLTQGKIYE